MSAAGYGRRAAAPSQRGLVTPGIRSETSGDYNPIYVSQELPSAAVLAKKQHGGPRPLEWRVGAAIAASNAPVVPADDVQWGSHNACTSSGRGTSQQVLSEFTLLDRDGHEAPAAASGGTAALAGGVAAFAGLGKSAARKHNASAKLATDTTHERPHVVLGLEVAGYKSVLTKNPVSPSGYAIVQPTPSAASAKPVPAPQSAVKTSGGRSSAAAHGHSPYFIAAEHGCSAGSSCPAAPGGSSTAAAAAAAAALATLGGINKSSSAAAYAENNTQAAAHNRSYDSSKLQDYPLPDTSAAGTTSDQLNPWAAATTAGLAHGSAAALQWNVQEHLPSQQQPVAGRRTGQNVPSTARGGAVSGIAAVLGLTTAVELDPAAYSLGSSGGGHISNITTRKSSNRCVALQQSGYSPSYGAVHTHGGCNSGSAGDGAAEGAAADTRPPSQQMSKGLSKLKQLSTARLASRLKTPPENAASAVSDGAGLGSTSAMRGDSCGRANAVTGNMSNTGPSYSTSAARNQGGVTGQQQQQLQQQQDWGASSSNNTGAARIRSVTMDQRQKQEWGASSSSGNSSPHNPSAVAHTTSRGRSLAAPAVAKAAGTYGDALQRTAAIGRTGAGTESQFGPGAGTASNPAGFAGSGSFAQQIVEDQQNVLQPCKDCGRSFNPAALARHAKVCAKVFCQKRKVFNTQSQRLQGSEAAKFAAKPDGRRQQQQQQARMLKGSLGGISSNSRQQYNDKSAAPAAAKKSKWQQQSEQLRAAMQANNPGSKGVAAELAGHCVPELEDNRIPCPHCGRRFAELAAERHIPKCIEIRAKPTGLRAGGGKSAYMRTDPKR